MRTPTPSRVGFLFVLASTFVWSACSDQSTAPAGPDVDVTPLDAVVSVQDLRPAVDAQRRHTPALMATAGVVGTAVGLDAAGRPAVHVYAQPGHGALPNRLDGTPVRVFITGPIYALQQVKPNAKRCPSPPCNKDDGGTDVDLTARFARPVPIGASTGHPAITAGTLGARVVSGGDVFALSNNHVYSDENRASIGDAVIQPGPFDGGVSPADDIGTLAAYEPIDFSGACTNKMDAAISSTTTSLVGNSTPAGFGYGTPRSTTMEPAVRMRVMKVGRTTGFTQGSIQSINATVHVAYETAVACFSGQIITDAMSSGGDSGSLLVVEGHGKNKNDERKPVGLLFAGSTTVTIHSPIDPILTRFGVTIDGN